MVDVFGGIAAETAKRAVELAGGGEHRMAGQMAQDGGFSVENDVFTVRALESVNAGGGGGAGGRVREWGRAGRGKEGAGRRW